MAGSGGGEIAQPMAAGRLEGVAAVAREPATWVAALVALGLLVLSPLYGFHRDELYFIVAGRHPDFGYVDQPPITPLLSAAAAGLFGVSPTAIRILPALAISACVLLAAAIAGDLGGGRRARTLAAVLLAVSGFLAAGHLDSTATFDLLAWAVILWLTVRLLGGGDPRYWLAVGVVAGIGLENKHILLFLGASLVVGLALARRWDVLRSPWAWAGLGIALVIWAPNLVWQAAHGFPQLAMAAAIGRSSGDRGKVILELLLLAGPLLFPVFLAGTWWLLRDRASRPWRAIGYATLVLVGLVLVTGGKSYYAAGIYTPLAAAGAVWLDGWLDRGRRAVRWGVLVCAACASFAIVVVLVLPILPPAALARTVIPDLYKESAEQVGWPELVTTVKGVVSDLPAQQRARSVILTDNYGEAGALELLGNGLPPVYSGHNGYADWGPPPDALTTAVLVTHGTPSEFTRGVALGACEVKAAVDNGVGLANQEQGVRVWVCQDVPVQWSADWTSIRHLD